MIKINDRRLILNRGETMTSILQTMKFPGILRFDDLKYKLLPTFLFFCVILFGMTYTVFAGPEKIVIYFYSSETKINNFKSLKMEFDRWISKSGPYEFQPFEDRETFERHIKGKNKCLLLLSSWHYSNIHKKYSLTPSLVGVRNGQNHQKRILVAGKSDNMNSVVKGPVASASDIAYTRNVLRDMFADKNAADIVRILTVPKEIDALMSVGFKMSKSALITENALSNLKMLDPRLHSKMKTITEGKASLLPILAVPESFVKDAEKIVQIIKDLPNDSAGTNIVKMLDLDGWKTIDSSDKQKLEG